MTDIESPTPAVEPAVEPTGASAELPVESSTSLKNKDIVTPKPKRTVLKAAAAVVAAALVGVGIGEAIIQVHYAKDDKAVVAAAPTAPQPSASPSAAWGAKSNGNHFGSLRDLLLPVPGAYRLGPDAGALGHDSELGQEQLAKRLEKNLADVPEKYRDQVKKAWEDLHFLGSGVRTLVPGDNSMLVELYLDQFNQQAVSQTSQLYGAMVDDTGVFRHGPDVPGHPGARCVLPPLRPGDQLDYVHCFSAEGDLLVTMEVSGLAPLDQNKVVDLFRQQLDRLARPGASA
ncbi:hypothetical protein AB0K51_23075 [Kitasatospora sp. NPDC049285]|uniref:hypothetical protein n=1 Tax=Kitasatospora sp. NPDC049285 TaxID=3157096 RepID=UPI003449BDB7